MIRTVSTLKVRGTVVLLVRMAAAQVAEWAWIGDGTPGQDVMDGYEVRDVTGALLGSYFPLGHMATRMHVEYYDPAAEDGAGDFFGGGATNAIHRHAVARVLDTYRTNVGPVPAGEGFRIEEPLYGWAPRRCTRDCVECDAKYPCEDAEPTPLHLAA